MMQLQESFPFGDSRKLFGSTYLEIFIAGKHLLYAHMEY